MSATTTSHRRTSPSDSLRTEEWHLDEPAFNGSLVESARQMMYFRRELDKYFPKFTFHDEAWDVLLELFVSTAQGEELCVKQVLLSTGMPATSAMRLLERLETAGLILKSRSLRDRRQTIVSFTEEGLKSTSSMLKTFSQLLGIMEL